MKLRKCTQEESEEVGEKCATKVHRSAGVQPTEQCTLRRYIRISLNFPSKDISLFLKMKPLHSPVHVSCRASCLPSSYLYQCTHFYFLFRSLLLASVVPTRGVLQYITMLFLETAMTSFLLNIAYHNWSRIQTSIDSQLFQVANKNNWTSYIFQ